MLGEHFTPSHPMLGEHFTEAQPMLGEHFTKAVSGIGGRLTESTTGIGGRLTFVVSFPREFGRTAAPAQQTDARAKDMTIVRLFGFMAASYMTKG